MDHLDEGQEPRDLDHLDEDQDLLYPDHLDEEQDHLDGNAFLHDSWCRPWGGSACSGCGWDILGRF